MREEREAVAVVVRQQDGTFRLGDEDDIVIGKPCCLLLHNGQIVCTSPVDEWRKYKGFSIMTANSIYRIACSNIIY